LEWIAVALVAVAVYTAIFLAIRANVRRLVAMRPQERDRAVRRQLIVTTVAAFALLAIGLLLLAD
jgi:hypothetical protein